MKAKKSKGADDTADKKDREDKHISGDDVNTTEEKSEEKPEDNRGKDEDVAQEEDEEDDDRAASKLSSDEGCTSEDTEEHRTVVQQSMVQDTSIDELDKEAIKVEENGTEITLETEKGKDVEVLCM